MISKPRVSDSLDILYELKDFLEYNDEIKDWCDDNVVVKKENNISKIVLK